MKRFFNVLALLFLCFPLAAAGFQLEPNRWESLVIPGNPEGLNIGQLLGDDMGSLDYGTDWAIYVFDRWGRVSGLFS